MTEKQYPLIHLHDKMYMVDKEAKVKTGDIAIDDSTESLYTKIERGYGRLNMKKVLASNDSSLELPLLPSIEEDIEKLAEAYVSGARWMETINSVPDSKMEFILNSHKKSFIAGYKANKALYTEEDMINCFIAGFHHQAKLQLLDDSAKEYLQSLKKLPIAVVVEMEMNDDVHGTYENAVEDGMPIEEIPHKIKVNEKGFVIIKKWIYD